MDEIVISLNIGAEYANEFVSLQPARTELRIELTAGARRIATDPVVIGKMTQFGGHDIMALLTLWYEFDADNNLLTICSDDHDSPDAPYISAFTCDARSLSLRSPHPLPKSNTTAPGEWNFRSQLHPGLEGALAQPVREMVDQIKLAAQERKLNLLVRNNVPLLPPDLYKKLCPVYKDGNFVEFYDETKTYSGEYKLGDFGSIYGGNILLGVNQQFSNVIGSTNDPKIRGLTWIKLWESIYGAYGNCSSYQTAGVPGFAVGYFACTASGVCYGGHSLLGQFATVVPAGNNYVFIIPICPAHNNNDNVYMEAVAEQRAVALHNYFNMTEDFD